MALDRLVKIRVLISFNGLRRGNTHWVPHTSRIRAFAELGFLAVLQSAEAVYELEPYPLLVDDQEDAGDGSGTG